MAPEGMVHALNEVERLLRPDGILIDIHPDSEGIFLHVIADGANLYTGRQREKDSEAVIHADRALARVIEEGIFRVERREEFAFHVYAPSVEELRAYWEELNAYEAGKRDRELVAREERLYGEAGSVLAHAGPNAQIVLTERVGLMRLIPLHPDRP